MKPQNRETMHSIDEKTGAYLDDVKEVTFKDTYPEMTNWIRRVRQHPAGIDTRFASRVPILLTRYKWGIATLLLIFLAGFIPLRDLDVLGYLIHAQVDGDIVAAAEYMKAIEVPQSQIEFLRLSEEETTNVVIFLPSVDDEDVAPIVEAVNNDNRIMFIEARRIDEEINRSAYNAFFSSLPASLSASHSKERMDLLRYHRLSQPVVGEWLNKDGVSYFAGFGMTGDSLNFSIIPGGGTPIPTEREALFEEYSRTTRAIELLQGDHPRVTNSRKALIVHRDSLEALISGTRK